MNNLDQNTLRILDILKSANSAKPWMTAKRIAEKSYLTVEETKKNFWITFLKVEKEMKLPKFDIRICPAKRRYKFCGVPFRNRKLACDR